MADSKPSQTLTKPMIFDKIVWKKEDVRRKRRKNVGNKSEDYLFNGKTFSLDNYVNMQGKEVGGDLNSGMKISASRTTGTEDFDKHISKAAIDIFTTSQANIVQYMLFELVDHDIDLCQSPFHVTLHTKEYESTSEISSACGSTSGSRSN